MIADRWVKEAEKLVEPFGFKLGFKKVGKATRPYVELPDGYKVWFNTFTQVVFFMKAIHEYIERGCKGGGKD